MPKQRIVDYSSDDDDPAADPIRCFVRMGYGVDQVMAAFRAHGMDAGEDVIVDYIAALNCASFEAPSISQRASSSTSRTDDFDVDNSSNEAQLRGMGFSAELISEALANCGSGADIETLATYILEPGSDTQNNNLLRLIVGLGYDEEAALRAIAICKTDDINVIVDHIDAEAFQEGPPEAPQRERKRQRVAADVNRGGQLKGFGLPGERPLPRMLTLKQARRPFFYFENVRTMPAGSWEVISGLLDNIRPEFVCASHFSVSRRARGYIHNLPLENRQALLPIPPKTLQEFLPSTVAFTPSWDTRTQLNCINTCGTTASFCRQVEELLKGELTAETKQRVLELVRKWNLVWTGPGTCSPLEYHEIERALGYEINHTRGGICANSRFKSLGNTFQVDVVGFHLSALKPLFPHGIRVLSLFSGIGGAEVALHRAGIPLKFVVSVECVADNRRILERWWKTSRQTGEHRILSDVQDLTEETVKRLVRESGGFDLVIGGSPCNNFTGSNRCTRTGLEGKDSGLFFEFPRILNLVRQVTP